MIGLDYRSAMLPLWVAHRVDVGGNNGADQLNKHRLLLAVIYLFYVVLIIGTVLRAY